LEDSFENLPTTTAYLRLDGDEKSEQIRQEIDLVIDARVKDVTRGYTENDRQKIMTLLKSVENRTYLWLHLTFDIIENHRTQYSRRLDVERLLSNLPTQVSDACENILSRSEDKMRTRILLQLVLAARRPLTLDEANYALTLALQEQKLASHAALDDQKWPREKFRSVVTNYCGLFISVYDSKISFIHQTAREFLTAPKREGKEGNWKGIFSLPQSHSTMSRLCLQYLLFPDVGRPAEGYSSGNKPFSDDDQYPFIHYSATHWPSHFIDQETALADQAAEDARMLCDVTGHHASIWTPFFNDWRIHTLSEWTNIALVSYIGLQQVASLLVDKGAGINNEGGPSYWTALQAASANGHQQIIETLLENGADVNIDPQGVLANMAHQLASAEGPQHIVEMLLENGADIDIQGGEYWTALQAASANDHQQIVEVLENATESTKG
jgi:ankyrin repeat domain-containing protein 50